MKRIVLLSVIVWASIYSAPAFATITITGPVNHVGSLTTGGGDKDTLNPDPFVYLASTPAIMQSELAAEFPGFTFNFSPPALPTLSGALAVNNYLCTSVATHNGGANLTAVYTRAETDPTIADLRFIQLVDTSRPNGGTTTPYIDPRPNDDTLPFYWSTANDTNSFFGNKTATTYRFNDNPSRTGIPNGELITWRGTLMLASFVDDGSNTTVNVYDGLQWGWNLQLVPEPANLGVLALIGAILNARHRNKK
jgi:hypothetical protein